MDIIYFTQKHIILYCIIITQKLRKYFEFYFTYILKILICLPLKQEKHKHILRLFLFKNLPCLLFITVRYLFLI